jgi:hypothetical protein
LQSSVRGYLSSDCARRPEALTLNRDDFSRSDWTRLPGGGLHDGANDRRRRRRAGRNVGDRIGRLPVGVQRCRRLEEHLTGQLCAVVEDGVAREVDALGDRGDINP